MSQRPTDPSKDDLRSGVGGAIWDRHITMPPRQFREAAGMGTQSCMRCWGQVNWSPFSSAVGGLSLWTPIADLSRGAKLPD